MYWIIDWRLDCISYNRNYMQRQSNVMIQDFMFRIVFLLISKITIILVTDRQKFTSE